MKKYSACSAPVWLAAVILLMVPADTWAFRVRGTVVNGTTESPVANATVQVVNPSGGGMTSEEEVRTDDEGRFVVDNLDKNVAIYLLRADYDGVKYSAIVRYSGADPYEVEIKVYESTAVWGDVRVAVPHLMARVTNEHLTVERIINISNETSPPRTIYGQDARFIVYIPDERLRLNSLYIMALGVPLSKTPLATDTPGFYAVDYPVKPGVTQMGVSFDVPYEEKRYTYTETLKYDLEEMVVLIEDDSLKLMSDSTQMMREAEHQGFTTYSVASLEAGATLSFTFTGGQAAADHSGHTQIVIVPNPTERSSIIMMITVAIFMLGIIAFAAFSPRSPETESTILHMRRETYFGQIARLDDLFRRGAVPEDVYQLKRTELKSKLSQILYRLKFDKQRLSRSRSSEDTARVS